ncbi:hypothetical protein [Pseudogracilibacillus sp. SO30301A]|uniref:hypothetical protein n=1 Tax=Pseudogracilibacillus sp. SO30301A TaxID=3098291 RepID=UPI00300E3A3F
MIKQILFLKRNRIRKKWKLNKQVILLSFDLTSLFYTLLVIGYFAFAIIAEGNIKVIFFEKMIQLEAFTVERFWIILTAIPIVYIIRSFQQPGVLFSTAEYILTILPHTVQEIWRVVALERWAKSLLTYMVGGGIIFLLSPTSLPLLLLYVFVLLGLNILMTTIEWKLFQQHVVIKIFILIGFISINIVNILLGTELIAILFIITLLIINIVLIPKLFRNIDWKKVTAASDFKIWNMLIVSQATKIKYKKERQYSMWQRMSFWKRPFIYEKTAGYHRLWHLYLEKNIRIWLQLIGALVLLMLVFLFVKDKLFLFAVAVTIHSFTTVVTSMFNDRLQTDIVQVLPWDLPVFKKTYMKWVLSVSVILLLPFIIYSVKNYSLWIFVQLCVIIFTFIFLLHSKIEKSYKKWDNELPKSGWIETLCYVLLLILIFSGIYPYLLVISCIIMGVIPFIKSKKSASTFP